MSVCSCAARQVVRSPWRRVLPSLLHSRLLECATKMRAHVAASWTALRIIEDKAGDVSALHSLSKQAVACRQMSLALAPPARS